MDHVLLRKLSYELYAANDTDLVKIAGPVAGLKRIVRRLLNKYFIEEAKNFQDNNSELKNVLQKLYGSFKELEDSIADYNMDSYRAALQRVKSEVDELNLLLSRIRGDVSKVEKDVKNDIKDRYNFFKADPPPPGPAAEPAPQSDAETASPPSAPVDAEDDSKKVNTSPNPEDYEIYVPEGEKSVEQADAPEEPVRVFVRARPDWDSQPVSSIPEMSRIYIAQDVLDNFNRNIEDRLEHSKKFSVEEITAAILQNGLANNWGEGKGKAKGTLRGIVKFELNSPKLKSPFQAYATCRLSDKGVLHVLSIADKPRAFIVSKQASVQMYKLAANLGPNFWSKFNAMASRLGMNPEDILTVMYHESGVNPGAPGKADGAAGLIQFMPKILKNLGWQGSQDDFRQLSGEEQLAFVERFIGGMQKFHGGVFPSAERYYIANFWPDSYSYGKYYAKYRGQPGWWPADYEFHDVRSDDPNAVIVEREPKFRKSPAFTPEQEAAAYAANPSLDRDRDGRITYGDFQKLVQSIRSSSGYKQFVEALQNAPNYTPGPQEESPVNSLAPHEEGLLKKLLETLQIEEVRPEAFMNHIVNELKSLASTNAVSIDVFGSDKVVNAEFVRLLSFALRREYELSPRITTSGREFRVTFDNYVPEKELNKLCIDVRANLQKVLGTHTAPPRFLVHASNTEGNGVELDVNRAIRLARMFRLKLISQGRK